MKILRWTLRISNAYTQLRGYRLECWQPSHCAICNLGYWMPHNQEDTTAELSAHSPFIDDAWWETHKNTILKSCTPTDKAILHGLYRRPGLCEEEDSLIPWIKAKHRRYVIASFERDAKAIQKVFTKHDTLFTL